MTARCSHCDILVAGAAVHERNAVFCSGACSREAVIAAAEGAQPSLGRNTRLTSTPEVHRVRRSAYDR
jgi:hypothetical protein